MRATIVMMFSNLASAVCLCEPFQPTTSLRVLDAALVLAQPSAAEI